MINILTGHTSSEMSKRKRVYKKSDTSTVNTLSLLLRSCPNQSSFQETASKTLDQFLSFLLQNVFSSGNTP